MILRDIRKLSVGKDYPDGAMHFQVGKPFRLSNTEYIVNRISINPDYLKKEDKIAYDVFLTTGEGTVLWKTIVDMPVIVEDNINFD